MLHPIVIIEKTSTKARVSCVAGTSVLPCEVRTTIFNQFFDWIMEKNRHNSLFAQHFNAAAMRHATRM
jgi:hypothetical protein